MSRCSINEIVEKVSGRKAKILGKYSFFSVLVPLIQKGEELFVLYEVRGDHLTRQPGEVCFPGGAMEPHETEKQCAIRETMEELGIPKKHIKVLCQLDTLHTYSNFTMYAFLGLIDYEQIQKMKVNPAEVKEFFLVPLDFFLENKPFVYEMDIIPDIREDFPYEMVNFKEGYNWRKGRSEVPIYDYEERVIWGLTARITENMVDVIRGK